MVFACGNDKVVRLGLLQDEPHALDIVLGIAPVAQGVQVAQIQFVLIALCDTCGSQRYLTCHEILATSFAFVIEQDTVAAEHAIRLAIVLHNPEAIQLGNSIRAAGIEWGGL